MGAPRLWQALTGLNAAIIAGSAIVGSSIALTNHWELSPGQIIGGGAFRLNRWTGIVHLCLVDPASMRAPGTRVTCDQRELSDAEVNDWQPVLPNAPWIDNKPPELK